MVLVSVLLLCLDLNHSNHVSSMDEEKAMQNLLDYPIDFLKYPTPHYVTVVTCLSLIVFVGSIVSSVVLSLTPPQIQC